MHLLADDVKNLHKYEIRILRALEKMMRHYTWVPEDILKVAVHLSATETKYRVDNLIHRGMVKSDAVPYKGYTLVFKGYDALALSTLAQKKTISALGTMIGIGKESEIYEVLGFGVIVLKLHKIGQRSFQTIRINREYMPEKTHYPWIFASVKSAEREYEALRALNGKINVPVPIDINRHVIVMSFIPGMNLHRCRLENPDGIWQEILSQIKSAYDAGFIHGDLSEYNIMYDDAIVWIIDWPQWIHPNHLNAEAILRHDIETVAAFFAKKYRREYDIDDAIRYVTDKTVK
ncbi:MAG: serine/threonine protein phosphatase [Methanocalculaceae archaeon]|jgi:RIO kinase 2|nr:serine/threonine protein phosphatase [Methanocalculaceae archaeon]